MTSTRHELVQKLWNGLDPFGRDPDPTAVDFQGWASDHRYLREAIRERKPRVVVEVGVWKGGSVLTMADEVRTLHIDAAIIAVDTWLGSCEHWVTWSWFESLRMGGGYPALYHTFASNVLERRLQDFVVPLPLDSVNASALLRHHKVGIDVLHIDAGHDFHSVMNDLRVWWQLLNEGGILIGDDYHPWGDTWPEVRQAFHAFFGSDEIENVGGKCRIRKGPSDGPSARRTGYPTIIQ